jgi:hypothetical protein
VSDPLVDPRAAELLAAQPDDVAALATSFHTAAVESRGTAVGLNAARHDGTWTGRAADAFRRAIGRLPAELETVRAGFEAVADALTVYEGELARIKPSFVRVDAELSDAQLRLGPAQATAHAAAGALTTTIHARAASTRALATAELAVARADGAVTGYTTEIATLRRRAFDLLDEFSTARGACRAAIAAAEKTAPVPRRTGHGRTVVVGGARIDRPPRARPLGRAHRPDRAHRPVRLPHHALGDVPPGQARETTRT